MAVSVNTSTKSGNAGSQVKVEAKNKATNYLNNDSRNTPYFDDNDFFKQLDDRIKWNINDRNNQYDKVLKDTERIRGYEQSNAQVNERNKRIEDQNNTERTMRLDANLKAEAASREANRSGGSFSESFGLGAAPPSGYDISPYGFVTYNASKIHDWSLRQNRVLDDQYKQAKRIAGIDRDNQEAAAIKNHTRSVDMMNRQSSIDAQRVANDRIYQSGEANKDRANQRYIAQLDANTRMYQSMFNGGNGFQYWGGSI